MIHKFSDIYDYDTIIEHSKSKPVFILKHSTACGVSHFAYEQFQEFVKESDSAEFWIVLVREQRPVSSKIAEKSGIMHQSPQIILFSGGKPVWDCSHNAITSSNLMAAMSKL